MVSAQLHNIYCRPPNNLDRASPINLGEDALPLLTPSVDLNSTRDGRSIPGYVLCMVSPLHARAFNLKMQRAANTQHPHKSPHRNGKFRLCPCVWPFPHFCQSNLRLFIMGCTINQVQACRGMHVFPSRPTHGAHTISCFHFILGSSVKRFMQLYMLYMWFLCRCLGLYLLSFTSSSKQICMRGDALNK